MRHLVVREVQPVLWPRQPSFRAKLFVGRRSRQRDERTEDGHSRRPRCYLFQRALSHARCIVVQAEDECGDRIDVTLREPVEHRRVFTGLVEALVHIREIERID